MLEHTQDGKRTSNVVPLGEFLKNTKGSFRRAVIEALAKEGFEMDETLPNLQLAGEILEAIDWLESRGHGQNWISFESALKHAGAKGILVDLGAFGRDTKLLDELTKGR